MEKAKMFLFARWMADCYADTRENKSSLSILNIEDGHWYKNRLNHFNEVVYPNYKKNGIVKETIEFLKK